MATAASATIDPRSIGADCDALLYALLSITRGR
jgi:hypothetical protein